MLTWETDFASSCTASGAWSGFKAADGSQVVAVPRTGANIFTLTCSNPGSPISKTVTVTGVLPAVTLRVFPDKPIVGQTVTISWDSTNALGCTASQGWSGAQAANGFRTFDVSAQGTLNYTIECSNDGGSASESASAIAVAAPALPPATGYMMNARHDGFVKYSGGITLPLTATPQWSRDLGADVGYAVIADGLVFVVSANTDGS